MTKPLALHLIKRVSCMHVCMRFGHAQWDEIRVMIWVTSEP